MSKRKLTMKQQAFADYYIETGNASESARRAGYSKTYATTHVYKLLENARITAYIDNRMEELKTERVANQQEILEPLTAVIRGEAKGTELVGKGKGKQAVQQEPPSISDKVRAAELLGKRYAMWTEKQEVNANITPVFKDSYGDEYD